MNTISVTYTLKFRLNFAHEYQFTEKGQCFNTKTGRKIKKVYNSRCIGYSIKGKLKSLTFLRGYLEKIPRETTPF